jgi:hypothetical protein
MDIFIHVAQIGRWQEILDEQLALIESFLVPDKIYIGVLGSLPVSLPANAEVCYQSDNLFEWEFPTLQKLYEHCQKKDGQVLYIHGKGSSQYKKCMEDWRHYLQYFLIEKYSDCLEALKTYDVCGCDWKKTHFFGNFWWARNDYIRTLRSPYDISAIVRLKDRYWDGPKIAVVVYSEEKGYHYFDENKFYAIHYRLFAELWVGSSLSVRPYNLHSSNVMHLNEEYIEKRYKIKL